MNVLVIGSGGREHALCWKIRQSPLVDELYCAPGNAGISSVAECVDINTTDFDKLVSFAKEKDIELTVVGPEVPLTLGIVDRFQEQGLKIFGPSRLAAEIEGSKQFSKDLMKKYGVPTAKYETFTELENALKFLDKVDIPFVVKADGLAAGKGVIICNSKEDGKSALKSIMGEKAFGDAGDKVIIEEFLTGEEASFFVFTDGTNILPLDSSQDHKAAYDGDKGPNTGGMGAYSPAPIVNGMQDRIINEVITPVIKGMYSEGRVYRGILYAGLMINNSEIKVLEFNCRFGDPEAQPLLMRMDDDLVPILYEIAQNNLKTNKIKWKAGSAVCVVMASKGYPSSYEKGVRLQNLSNAGNDENTVIFHAGTANKGNDVITNGGRVLGVTSSGKSLKDAIESAYKTVKRVKQDELYFRTDIGEKAL